MKRTTATGSVAGAFVDRIGGVQSGTLVEAADMNNHQEEICHPIELLGVSLSGTDSYQLEKSIIGLSKPVGEMFFSAFDETPVAWGSARNDTNPSNPRYLPVVKLFDDDHVLDVANYPLLVPKLRAKKTQVWNGSAYVTDLSVTVAGSVATFSGTAGTNLLAAWAEEVLVHGGYTNGWILNIAGTDYVVANVNSGGMTATVTGTPASGSQTAIVYQHRISGSTTTARVYKSSGRVLMSPDGVTYVPGARRRDRMQGHEHSRDHANGNLGSSAKPAGGTTATGMTWQTTAIVTDGTNGTPRTGSTTDPNMTVGYLYMWAGVYQ